MGVTKVGALRAGSPARARLRLYGLAARDPVGRGSRREIKQPTMPVVSLQLNRSGRGVRLSPVSTTGRQTGGIAPLLPPAGSGSAELAGKLVVAQQDCCGPPVGARL